jgi:hypothetical protein
MIFLDESGKRWRRIKHSTTGLGLLCVLPVLALVGGSLAYQPQWGILPLSQEPAPVVLSGATTAQPGPASSPSPGATPKPSKTPAKPTARLAYQATATSLLILPTPTPAPKAARITPAPAPTPSPTPKPNPTQNNAGQAHKPIR